LCSDLHHSATQVEQSTTLPSFWQPSSGDLPQAKILVLALSIWPCLARCHFTGAYGFARSSLVFFLHWFSGREPLRINGAGFYRPDILSSTQPAMTKHCSELKALTQ